MSPGIRQASADVAATTSNDPGFTARHQNMLERLHATSVSSSRLRSGKDASGFSYPTPLAHQSIAEQLLHILPADETNVVPDMIVLLSAYDVHCSTLVQTLKEKVTTRLAVVSNQSDVKIVMGTVLNRIQK